MITVKNKKLLLIALGVVCVLGMMLAACEPNVTMTSGNGTGTGNGASGTIADNVKDTEPKNSLGDSVYYADIEIKDYGTITVRLDQNAAPVTVANFVELAQSGFYDGLTFHRIIYGFMMQGGDPLGNGFGGAEKNIYGEFANNGFKNNLSHKRGVISMARATGNNTASSQFFIVHKDSESLDGDYAAFGYVTEGMDIVDAICESARPIDNNGMIAPEDQPVMVSVKIRTE